MDRTQARALACRGDELAVEPERAKLIDEHRQAAAGLRIGDEVTQEGRLAGAEKSADEQHADAGKKGGLHRAQGRA